MTGRLEPLLTAQLGALEAAAGEPDWNDVRNRASRRAARRMALRVGGVALISITAVLAATPALGLQDRFVRLFSSGEPAPARVVKDFQQLNTISPGLTPSVIADQAREVMEVPLSTGESAVLRVAPTRAGGFCLDLSTSGPEAEGGGGCDSDRSLPFSPGLSIPGPISPEGNVLKPPVVIDGDTLVRGAAKVEIDFQDGEVAETQVVWVSKPIDAGFFIYEVPKRHWEVGHRPSALVVRDAAGRQVYKATNLGWPFVLTEPSRNGGVRPGLSVYTTQAGLRQVLWAGSGIVAVGAGRSRATAVFVVRPAPGRRPG